VNTVNGCSTFTLNDTVAQTVAYDITSAGLTTATGTATFNAPIAPAAAPTVTAVGGTVVANILNSTNTSEKITGTVALTGDVVQLYINGVPVVCTATNCTNLVGATINPNGTLTTTATTFSVNVTNASFGADGAKAITYTDSGSAASPAANITKDTAAPSMTTSIATNVGTASVTYNEAVNCNALSPSQFVATRTTPTAQAPVTATGVSCNGTTTVTLTFPATTFTGVLGTAGTLTYTQSATAANRVKDLAGNDATSPQTVAMTLF